MQHLLHRVLDPTCDMLASRSLLYAVLLFDQWRRTPECGPHVWHDREPPLPAPPKVEVMAARLGLYTWASGMGKTMLWVRLQCPTMGCVAPPAASSAAPSG